MPRQLRFACFLLLLLPALLIVELARSRSDPTALRSLQLVGDERPPSVAPQPVEPAASPPCAECGCPCDDGPYVWHPVCPPPDGLGSRFERMMDGLILAAMLQLHWMTDARCLFEAHEGLDFADFLGLRRTARCDPCSLRRRIANGSSIPPFQLQQVQQPTLNTTCLRLDWHSPQALLQDPFPELDASESAFDLPNVRLIHRRLRESRPALRSSLVFQAVAAQPRFQQYAGACLRDWLHQRYAAAVALQTAQGLRALLPFRSPDSRISLCLHFRWGDVATGNTSKPDWRSGYTLPEAVRLLQSIDRQAAFTGRSDVWLFAEGRPNDFAEFARAFPAAHLRLGSRSPAPHRSLLPDDLDALCHCDVAVGGMSAFFHLVFMLSGDDGVLVADTTQPKYSAYGSQQLRAQTVDVHSARLADEVAERAERLGFFRPRHQRFAQAGLYNSSAP